VSDIDSSTPHEARVYDYLLGGKSNYEVDRLAGDQILRASPQMPQPRRALGSGRPQDPVTYRGQRPTVVLASRVTHHTSRTGASAYTTATGTQKFSSPCSHGATTIVA
jgi:hypothetical protein